MEQRRRHLQHNRAPGTNRQPGTTGLVRRPIGFAAGDAEFVSGYVGNLATTRIDPLGACQNIDHGEQYFVQ